MLIDQTTEIAMRTEIEILMLSLRRLNIPQTFENELNEVKIHSYPINYSSMLIQCTWQSFRLLLHSALSHN